MPAVQSLPKAIAAGKAPITACAAGGSASACPNRRDLGVKVDEKAVPNESAGYVLWEPASCPGASNIYAGALDCIAAAKLGEADRVCPKRLHRTRNLCARL